jgi:hypothetical protein
MTPSNGCRLSWPDTAPAGKNPIGGLAKQAVAVSLMVVLTLVFDAAPLRAEDDQDGPETPPPAAAPSDEFSLDKELESERRPPATPADGDAPGEAPNDAQLLADEETLGDPTGSLMEQLDRTVARMRGAARSVTDVEQRKAVRIQQSRALKDLDELIRQLEEALDAPPQQPSESQSNPPPESPAGDPPPQGEASPQGGKPSQPKSGAGQAGQGKSGQKKPSQGEAGQGGKKGGGKKRLTLRSRGQGGPGQVARGPSRTPPSGKGQPQPEGQSPPGQPNQGDPNRPGDSVEGTRPGEARPAEDPLTAKLTKDVWGHLPPHLREQLLNVYSEKYLPKYEELVRQYYEALAQQSRDGSSRSNNRRPPGQTR